MIISILLGCYSKKLLSRARNSITDKRKSLGITLRAMASELGIAPAYLSDIEKDIITLISKTSFMDSQSTDGFRKCWYDEFNYIYVFNLRGDQRIVGEKSCQEGV